MAIIRKKIRQLQPHWMLVLCGGVALSCWGLAQPAHADSKNFLISEDAPLRFGAFVAFTSGSRTISPTGQISNDNIWPASGVTGPAQFTVTYDRGNSGPNDRKPLRIQIELLLNQVPPINQEGVVANMAGFTTDIPGYANIQPGNIIPLTINNCVTKICSVTFHAGARLEILRSTGGAKLLISMPFTVKLVGVED